MVNKHGNDEQLPPIPDGGLADSMPDWLRRPPAWQMVSGGDSAKRNYDHSHVLSQGETSVIDPRTLLTEEDLPLWLRSLRHPIAPAHEDASGQERVAETEGVAVTQTAAQASRFVPRSMPPASHVPDRTIVRKEAPARGRHRPAPPRRAVRWQGLQLILLLLLAGALLVAVLAIVMLLL
jgi:hypothetical protein